MGTGVSSKYADGGTFTMALRATRGTSTRSRRRAASCSPSASSPTTPSSRRRRDGRDRVTAGDRVGRRRHDRHAHPATASPAPTAATSPRRRRRQHRLRRGPEEQEPVPRHLPAGRRDREGRRRRRHGDDHAGPARAVRAQRPRQPADGLRRRHGGPQVARRRHRGTGPYELTEAVPGDHYTYQIRDGYTWGPNGATTAEEGMPDTVVMKIVAEREHRGQPARLRRDQRRPDHRPRRRASRARACSRPRPRPCWASSGTTTTTATRPATPTCGWR